MENTKWVIAWKKEEMYYGNTNGEMLSKTLEDAVKYDMECDAAFDLEDAIELEILDEDWEVKEINCE